MVRVRGKVHWTNAGYVYIYIPSLQCSAECKEFLRTRRNQYVSVYVENGEIKRYRGKVWKYLHTFIIAIQARFADERLLSLIGQEVEVKLGP
ncbi:MAG: hypothetical protein QXI07_11615 [Pyrobaculum sp.]